MPSNRNVDERIVEMRLDNENFEKSATKTISTLEKLERALHLKGDTKAFDDMSDSVSRFDANPMVSGLEKIKEGFSALEIVGMRVISNLTDSVYNFATRTIKSFTIDPIMQGMGKFGEKTTAVSTLTAQGYELEKVNKLMEDLNWFTDETSYNFTDMVGNIAKFTATGQDLDQSVTAMEGIALWAAVSGQNATKASMAMYQLSQAMGKGALKYDDYKSIQNASMDTQEFRKQAAAAAVELGVLNQVGEDSWMVNGKTFDLAGLFSSDALSREQWFTSDVMMKVFNQYSRAVAAVQKYLDDHADSVDTASEAMRLMEEEATHMAQTMGITVDEAFKRLGYDMDEFSLKALKAGQNARTWGDVVDSVKDAVSTGWMQTFEHLFGDAETATKFWTDIANKFYDIFAEGGNTRNEILKLAFGKSSAVEKGTGGVKNLEKGWESFEKRLESSGKTMEDFEKALYSVADRAALDTIENFNGVDDALRKGGISAELFQKAMEALLGTSDQAMSDTATNAQHASHSLEEMREVALGILRGDYGNGEERRKAIEEMGYDYELMQAMAGNLKWGGYNMSDEKLIDWMERYYRYNKLAGRLGANTFAEYIAQTGAAAEEATGQIESYADIYEAVVHGIEEVDATTGKRMSGGEYFRGALLNIIDTIMDVQGAFRSASETVFGAPEDIAKGLYKLVKGFYNFTAALRLGEGTTAGLTTIFTALLSIVKGAGTVFSFLGKVAGYAFRGLMQIVDVIGSIIGKVGETKTFENFGKAFTNIFKALERPLQLVAIYTGQIFEKVRNNVLPGFLDKLGTRLEKISGKALELSEQFKTYLESWEFAEKVATVFGYIQYYLRGIRDGFRDLDLGAELEKLWNWISGIFTGIKPEESSTIEALEEVRDVVEPISRAMLGDPSEIKNRISTFFQTVKDSIKEELGKITFSDFFNAVKVTAMTVLLAKLAGVVENFRSITKGASSIPEAISEVIGKAGDVLVAFRKNITANAYIKIAAAIAILTASLWALSKIPRDDLTHVATVMALLMGLLALIVRRMGGMGDMFNKNGDKNFNIGSNRLKISVFNGLAAKLIGFAAILGTVVAALLVVRKMNPTTIVTTLIGVVTLIGGIALVIEVLSELPNFNAKGVSLTLLSLALALQMLMLPMAELALFTLDSRGNAYMGALFGIIALLAALTTVIFVFSRLENKGKTENLVKIAGSMALVALAVGLLVVPLAALAALPGSTMGKAFAGLLGISLIIGIMAAMLTRVGALEGSDGILKMAGSMVLIALAMNMMIPVLGAFAGAITFLEKKYTWEKIKANLLPLGELAIILTGFAFAALLMGFALSKLGSGTLKIAGSFFLFSVALLALSFGLGKLAEAFPVFIEGLANAGKTIRGREKDFIWGGIAFVTFAGAIALLVTSLSNLFKMGNVGAKLGNIATNVGTTMGGLIKKVGKKMLDNMPTMLQMLGAIVVLVGLYFLDIIPQLTEIAVNAVTIFLDSLADNLEKNRAQIVDSVTSIVKTVFGIFKDVINNVWNDASPAEKIITVIAVCLFAADKLSMMLGGRDGKGGLVGSFVLMTKGVQGSVEGMAAGTMLTMGKLFWWLLGIAAIAYAVYNGIKTMDRNEKEFDDQFFEGHGKDVEGYIHAIEKAKKEYEDAYNKFLEEDQKFLDGTSELTAEEYNGMQIKVNTLGAAAAKYEAQLREYLGLTKKEFDTQLAAAGGDYSQMEAVKTKLAEIEEAAKAAAESVDQVTNDTKPASTTSKEQQLEEVKSLFQNFYTEVTQGTSGEATTAGEGGAEAFSNGFMSYIFGEDGKSLFTDSGEFSSDTAMNGMVAEAKKYMPDVSADTISGYLSGIFSQRQDIFNGGSWVYDMFESGYRSRSATASPSRKMMTMGEYAIDGLVLGIVNQAGEAYDAGVSVADEVMAGVTDAMAMVSVMADEQFDISPTVTPIVDTSQLNYADSTKWQSEHGRTVQTAAYNTDSEYERWRILQSTQDKLLELQQDQEVLRARDDRMFNIWDEYAIRADEVSSTVETSIANSSMNGIVSDLADKVDVLGSQIANMQVVLDSGQLVGGIAYNMDRQLGLMSSRRGRGN